MSDPFYVLIMVIALIIGAIFGYQFGRKSVASDCAVVGGFYEGKHIFECSSKGPK